MRGLVLIVAWLAAAPGVPAQEFVWPTPRPAIDDGRPYAEFVQPTESGLVESGLFGCGRTSGRQFHEGLDLRPLHRDRQGEATDEVRAVAAGVVRHVNSVSGQSNYGRYVVIEHSGATPAVSTLYAHLRSVAPGVQPGATVTAGGVIGVMGRSASTGIPRERAHLHLEIGFMLGRGFQGWYDRQKFGSRNEHGLYNGMNFVAFDFLDFMERRRRREVEGVRDYLQGLPVAATVVVRRRSIPDFVERYPELLQAAPPVSGVAAWRIDFTWFGLPKAWWPLDAAEAGAVAGSGDSIVFHDRTLLDAHPCQSVVRHRDGQIEPGSKMRDVLDIIFTPAR